MFARHNAVMLKVIAPLEQRWLRNCCKTLLGVINDSC